MTLPESALIRTRKASSAAVAAKVRERLNDAARVVGAVSERGIIGRRTLSYSAPLALARPRVR